jgi:hypothetical protein
MPLVTATVKWLSKASSSPLRNGTAPSPLGTLKTQLTTHTRLSIPRYELMFRELSRHLADNREVRQTIEEFLGEK